MRPPKITYKIHEDGPEDWMSGEPTNQLWRCEDGVKVEVLGSDGGEPEDNTLRRDWSWIAPALQAAYELGIEHGRW